MSGFPAVWTAGSETDPVASANLTAEIARATARENLVESGGVPRAITATGYDTAGNLTSITENGVTTTYTYDASGNAITETRFGVTKTYSYNAAGNLTGATVV